MSGAMRHTLFNGIQVRVPLQESGKMWSDIIPIAVIITIEENIERVESSLNECNRIGLFPHVIISKKNKRDTIEGCWRSHQIAAEYTFAQGLHRVLILEDDIVVNGEDDVESTLKDISNFLKYKTSDEHWSMFMLGSVAVAPTFDVYPRIVEGTKFRYTHAYILSRKGMGKLVAQEYVGEHVDKYLGDSTGDNDKIFALNPQMILQRDVPSTNNSFVLYNVAANLRNAVGYKRLTEFLNLFMRMLGKYVKK